jgi:hypothetical protein
MTTSNPGFSDERIVDALIELARAEKQRRMIVAGSNSADIFLELHRRGFSKVTTTRTSRAPCGQHDVALVASDTESIETLEVTFDRLAHFLSASGVLVVWIGPHEHLPDRKLRVVLGKLGFRIESGTVCENGVAIAARRLESSPAAKAA